MTISTERDFKSEYLFRMCSVVTNLVTSLEFNPIHCATMLYHFGQTRNSSVAIHLFLRRSTAMSSATGDYIAVPERFGQNEEPAVAMRNEQRRNLVLFPGVDLANAISIQTCKNN